MAILESSRNSGRAKALFEFTQGLEVDARLATQEIRVQKAWARGLVPLGVITETEFKQASAALDEAQAEMAAGKFNWRVEDEDVHMNLERFVTERAGALGKKMHAGRSRNDLIATTLRLFTNDALALAQERIRDLILALVERAEKDMDVLVPGLTHVQHGQPIRHSQALSAHAWGLTRDLKRLAQARELALETMPLGAAALSGTPLAIDLPKIAKELGFAGPSKNSYDSVSDRDFMVAAIDALAGFAIHLSRLSEDCILWSSTSIGLVRLPKAWSTGSSIMPNKRNPDVPELARAKSAHIIGAQTDAHTLLKAVPTSYGSDLHELKQVLMRALDESLACLSVFPEFIRGLEPNPKRAEELLNQGHILATEIADDLVAQGLPFREAYAQVAALVERAESSGVQIHQLPDYAGKLSFSAAVEKRANHGGTARAQLLAGLAALRSVVAI